MKSALVCLGLLVVLSCSLAHSQGRSRIPKQVKGNIWYSVRGENSQVLLLFKGPVQHTETLAGNTLTITCTNIVSTPSQSGANLQFKDGLVRHVTLDRIVDGSTRVVLTLKTGRERFAVALDDAQGVLRVEVFPNPFAVKPRVLAQTITPKIKVQEMSKEPENQSQQTPFIDLSALVRAQVEKANPENESQPALTPPATKSRSQQILSSQGRAAKSVLPWLILACVSLLVTLCSIIVLVVVALRRNKQLQGPEAPLSNHPSRLSHPRLQESAPERGIKDRNVRDLGGLNLGGLERLETIDEIGIPTVSLAEQYQRSQGDIELAMKLREKAPSKEQGAKVGVINAVNMPKKGTVRIARRLGVGTGELDLATKLRKLQDVFSEKEAV